MRCDEVQKRLAEFMEEELGAGEQAVWVLTPIPRFRTTEVLLENLRRAILERARKKHIDLQNKKTRNSRYASIRSLMS